MVWREGRKTKIEAISVPFKIIGAEAGTANLLKEFKIPESSETKEIKLNKNCNAR